MTPYQGVSTPHTNEAKGLLSIHRTCNMELDLAADAEYTCVALEQRKTSRGRIFEYVVTNGTISRQRKILRQGGKRVSPGM